MQNEISKNALVVRPGSLGDLICTIPVFISLAKNGFNVYLIGNERLNPFFEKREIIKKGIGFSDIRLVEMFSETKKISIPEFPDFVLVIVYIESNGVFFKNLLLSYGEKMVVHPVPENLSCNVSEYLLQPLRKIGLQIYYPEIKKKTFNNTFFIHPGSGSKKKNWKKENFVEVFHHFKKKYKCRVILGECEIDDYKYWEKNIGKHNIIVPDDITVLSQVLETGDYYLGNDSGVSHLAAFLGLKTFIIFGPTDPEIWAPETGNVKIIRTDIGCSPCKDEKRFRCPENICLKKIKPGYIISLIEQEIEKGDELHE
ncbi:MAG: glycosyltransferase family 9 protein [bacterium]|nr:glycosyltransferase family 9 protein [bacterium]